jgi:hypothetical protein
MYLPRKGLGNHSTGEGGVIIRAISTLYYDGIDRLQAVV